MNQPLVSFTHEGIPPLPETAEAPRFVSAPTSQPGFGAIPSRPADGIPEFENVPRRNADGSFSMVEFVTIKTPGDNKAAPRHKVTDRLREMYRPYYEAWRQGLEMSPVGTPLEAWPIMDRALVQACKALNIFTVEQLAETADANIHRLPMGKTLKNRARDWLKTKKDADMVDQISRQKEELRAGQEILEQQNASLAAELEETRKMNERLAARLDALEEAATVPQPAAASDIGDRLDRAIDGKSQTKPKAKT